MNVLPFLFVICAFLFTTNAHSQVIVLINEVATRVDHVDGDLEKLYEEIPDYMDGFEKSPYDMFTKVPPRLLSELTASNDIAVVERTKTADANNLVDSDKTEEDNNAIYFKSNSVTIGKKYTTKIGDFSKEVTSGKARSVLLKSWYKTDDDASQDLAKQRLEACKKYMEKEGVPSNLILTSVIGSNKASNYVSVLLQ